MRRLHIVIKLRYKGKEYEFIDDHSDFDFVSADEPNPYWWEEGNGGCDCNRSLYIKRHCDPTFPEMDCGHEIELLSQDFKGDWSKTWTAESNDE